MGVQIMTVNELKLSIFSKELSNLYVFYGDELEVQKAYYHKISEVTESQLDFIDNISDVNKYSGSFLFSAKTCFVCFDISELQKAKDIDKALESLQKSLKDNILIVICQKLDKRSALYKALDPKYLVTFEKLHPEVLKKHVLDHIKLSNENCKTLMEICEYDYGRCLLEIDKINKCGIDDSNAAFEQLLTDGTINQPPGDKIFELIDAILSGKPKTSFRLLEECKQFGESQLKILLVLFTNLKHLLQVQSCEGNVKVVTGLSDWEIKQANRYCGVYSNWELVKALKTIQSVEKGIKTGMIEEPISVDYVLVNLF